MTSRSEANHEYRGYTIRYNPKPIPDRRWDWDFTHKDYDGGYYDAEGCVCEGDPRAGSGVSIEDCQSEIDMMEGDIDDALAQQHIEAQP